MGTSKEEERLKSPCVQCGITWHYVRSQIVRADDGDPEEFHWQQKAFFLECAGCGSTSLRKEYIDETMEEPNTEVLPPPTLRDTPSWVVYLDDRFVALLTEIYESLRAGALVLPVMGARTILDLVIADKVGDQGDFKSGLDALQRKGLLSPHDRKHLQAAIEAGNAAAHRRYKPEAAEVDTVMEIVEHLLNSQYILDRSARALKKKTPKRRRRSKKRAPTVKG